MKRAWFQRIRGGGCQTLVYGGKNPCVATLFVFPPFLFHQPLQWLAFVAGGQLWLVVEAVIAFGSGVEGLSVPFPHAHSTHDFLHSTLPRLPSPHGLLVPHVLLFIHAQRRFSFLIPVHSQRRDARGKRSTQFPHALVGLLLVHLLTWG